MKKKAAKARHPIPFDDALRAILKAPPYHMTAKPPKNPTAKRPKKR